MKQPNWKNALILSTTVFVLGSFTYWLQFSHKPKKDAAEQDEKKPLPFAAETDQIAGFRIQTADRILELECQSLAQKNCKVGTTGDWGVTRPEKLKGDGDAIRDFLNNLSSMTATDSIDLSEETEEKRARMFEEYGLTEAKRLAPGAESIELRLENGKKLALWFGAAHPFEDKVYTLSAVDGQVNSRKAFLVANYYRKSIFGKSLTSFRDKTLFTFDRQTVEAFEAKTPAGSLRAEKSGGLWSINGLPADDDRITTLLVAIHGARAKEFPEDSAWKGARPEFHYVLHPKGAAEVSFDLLVKKPQKKGDPETVFLRTPALPRVVEVEGNLKVQVDRSASYLRRNLLLTQAEKSLATRFRIEGKAWSSPVEFHQEGALWAQKSGDGKYDPEKLKTLIDQMAASHSPGIASPAPPAGAERITLTLGDEKNPAKARWEIYAHQGKAWARDLLGRRNEALELEPGLKNLVPFSPDSWKVK